MISIVFADNDPNFLSTRTESLENEGYQVLKALTLEEARRFLAEAHVHLAVLDIRLVDDDDDKDVSGLTLAKDPTYHSVPKIILTGFPTYQAVREALGLALDGMPPAVDFLAKQEGPEALIQVIKQTLAQHVCINWCLNIRWGKQGELPAPYLVSIISPQVAGEWMSDRAGELEDLLRKLFCKHDQVTLGQVLARREGWVLLTAFAYPSRGPEEQLVMACGQRAKVQAEQKHHRAFVPHNAEDRTASLVDSAETVHFGAVAYRLGGCAVEEVATFKSFYHQQPTDMVLTAADDLFRVTLHPWYERGQEKRQQPLEALCREWLGPGEKFLTQPEELEKRVNGICQAALAAGVTGLDCSPYKLTFRPSGGKEFSYPNPVPYLCEERITLSPPTLCGITHGRLDGASVLVDRTGQTWVADFGMAGLGPLIRDFVSFETSVKVDILKGADAEERHELERRLLAVRNLGEEIDTQGVGAEVEKALRVIGQIRSRAADVVGPDVKPYFMGLLFCVAGFFLSYQPELRYTREETVVFAHALLFMGMLCQRLVAWEDRILNLPSQAVDSLWIDMDNQEVWVEGRQVVLTPQGFSLLKYLYDHANTLCKRADIARHVFGAEYPDARPKEKELAETDLINTSISRLRNDIEPSPSRPKYILTVRGWGYKLVRGGDSSST